MNNCTHDFHIVRHLQETVEGIVKWDWIAVVVCAYCGHTRWLYDDGRIMIIRKEGEIIRPPVNTKADEARGH